MAEQQLVKRRAFAALTTDELYRILRLRSDVFVVEQECAYADVDGRDTEPATTHWWIDAENEIAAYARTMSEPDGSVRIGRVVTAPSHRGHGLAARLIESILSSFGADAALVLDAQSHLGEWYQRFGFEVAGPEFIEDGIPHVPMRRPFGIRDQTDADRDG